MAKTKLKLPKKCRPSTYAVIVGTRVRYGFRCSTHQIACAGDSTSQEEVNAKVKQHRKDERKKALKRLRNA